MKSSALLPSDEAASLSLADNAQIVSQGIVSKTVLAAPGMRAALFSFAAEQVLTEHTSTSRALIHILSGECEFSVAGSPRILRAGDLLHLPPSVPHALRATEAMTMLLVLSGTTTAT
jgi:quercetin dioxygenase-like cupin family protein